MNKMLLILPAFFASTLLTPLHAASFQLLEQEGGGVGEAYAGSAALAEKASTVFYNPAGMSRLKGVHISSGISLVSAYYSFQNEGSTGRFLGNADSGNAGEFAAIPNFYVTWAFAKDWTAGFGVSVPFGMTTEYENPAWVGRVHSLKTSLETINLNPSLAWQANEWLSIGAGLNYQTAKAKLTSALPAANTQAVLKGDASAWGWNAGVLITPTDKTKIGLSYRSEMRHQLEGDLSTPFGRSPVKTELKLPSTWIVSVAQTLSDRWLLLGDFSYTHWRSLQTLNILNPNTGAKVSEEVFGYQDSWRAALGARYRLNDAWQLTFGTAYDKTPTTDKDRSARVPDNNRIWLSTGLIWDLKQSGRLDLGYAYIKVQKAQLEQHKTIAGQENVLRGSYDPHIHLFGLQYSVGF